MPRSPDSKKPFEDNSPFPLGQLKKKLKKRNTSKTRSVNKMPAINNPPLYFVPREPSQINPNKQTPRRIRTLNVSNTPHTKNFSYSRQLTDDSHNIVSNSTQSINITKIKFPGISETITTSLTKIHTEEDEQEETKDKGQMSPIKKTLQVLTSSPTKSTRPEAVEGFSQAVNKEKEDRSWAKELLSVKKNNSQPIFPGRKEKNSTPVQFASKRQILEPLDNYKSEVIDTNREEDPALPYIPPTKHSLKGNGVVEGYAANTSQGLVRTYNEDRVAIILNISKPPESTYEGVWPVCSFFAIYDGHGGEACADFLRDNLHQMIVRNESFPSNPMLALKKGFAEAEAKFLELAEEADYRLETSGSCAIVVLIVNDICYTANVGDSRAVMSCEGGRKTINLSRDHKPSDDDEKARIIKHGGKIYQTHSTQQVKTGTGVFASSYSTVVTGPCRVFPGRLAISRAFGDIEAKLPKFDGIPGVVIAEPEIKTYKITQDCDFIVLASDGIYDKLSSEEVVECTWNSTCVSLYDVHRQAAAGVEYIMKQALLKKTSDNITVLMVALAGFKNAIPTQAPEVVLAEDCETSNIPKEISEGIKSLRNSDYSGIDARSKSTIRRNDLRSRGNDIRIKKRVGPFDKSEDSGHKRILVTNPESRKNKNSVSFTLGKSVTLPKKEIKGKAL